MLPKIHFNLLFAVLLTLCIAVSCSKENLTEQKYDAETIEYDLTILSEEDETYVEAMQKMVRKYLPYTSTSKENAAISANLLTRFQKINEKMIRISDSLQISGVKCLSVLYNSTGVDKKRVKVSGKIYIPEQTTPIRGIIIANHTLITDNASAPSQSLQVESLLAFMGYVVTMSDYIGFGSTVNLPQTFLAEDITAKTCIDLALTARKYLNDNGYKSQYPDNPVYITGYSQGGGVTLACQKLIETYYPKEFTIQKSFAGSGAYDLEYTFKDIISNKESNIPLVIVALAFDGLNYGENLNLDLSKYFKGRLLQNYKEWLNSKKYTALQIEKLIGGSNVKDILNDSVLDYSNNIMEPYRNIFKKNSLVEWRPKSPIFLYHSTYDDYIPQYNAQEAYEYFKKHSSAKIEADFDNYGSHLQGAIDFYFKLFEKIK